LSLLIKDDNINGDNSSPKLLHLLKYIRFIVILK
jgi:hypothetical protein